MACGACENCADVPTAGVFVGKGRQAPGSGTWYPGREYPCDPGTERSVQYKLFQNSTELMQVDNDASTGLVRYKSFAEEAGDNPWLDPSALVAEADVPGGQTVLRVRVTTQMSDPSQERTVWFAVYNGTNRIVAPWDGATNTVVEPHMGGGRGNGGEQSGFAIRAIIDPRRWSDGSAIATDPLRTQMRAFARIEMWTVTLQPASGGCE